MSFSSVKISGLITLMFPDLFKTFGAIVVMPCPRKKLIKNDIAIYSAHTNADSASGGVSFNLAEQLGVTNLKILDPKELSNISEPVGLGVYGELKEEINSLEFLKFVKEKLGLKSLRYSNINKESIKSVAMCGGSGASYINRAKNLGIDLYLTGDIKYHDYFLPESNIIIADIGHYESEIFILDTFKRLITNKFADIAIYKSSLKGNPINIL